MTPLPTSTILFASSSDRAFAALVARETKAFFRFDLLSATLEHTPGALGESFVVALTSPPPAVISHEPAGRSEPAPAVPSGAEEGTSAAPPVEVAREPREPRREPPLTEVEKPEKPTPVTPREPGEPVGHEPDASPPVTSTPEPATLALTASGLAALVGYAKRRRKSNREH
jgi:hypothetical protein